MTWIQVIALALSITVALFGAIWAVFRPLLGKLIEEMVIRPMGELKEEVRKTNCQHAAQIRALEIETARVISLLEAKGCLLHLNSKCKVD